jgi:hypothetical protein
MSLALVAKALQVGTKDRIPSPSHSPSNSELVGGDALCSSSAPSRPLIKFRRADLSQVSRCFAMHFVYAVNRVG